MPVTSDRSARPRQYCSAAAPSGQPAVASLRLANSDRTDVHSPRRPAQSTDAIARASPNSINRTVASRSTARCWMNVAVAGSPSRGRQRTPAATCRTLAADGVALRLAPHAQRFAAVISSCRTPLRPPARMPESSRNSPNTCAPGPRGSRPQPFASTLQGRDSIRIGRPNELSRPQLLRRSVALQESPRCPLEPGSPDSLRNRSMGGFSWLEQALDSPGAVAAGRHQQPSRYTGSHRVMPLERRLGSRPRLPGTTRRHRRSAPERGSVPQRALSLFDTLEGAASCAGVLS